MPRNGPYAISFPETLADQTHPDHGQEEADDLGESAGAISTEQPLDLRHLREDHPTSAQVGATKLSTAPASSASSRNA